jgi:hypothetical protein
VICILVFPAVLLLLLSKTVAEVKSLMQMSVLCFLDLHLRLNYDVKQLDLAINALRLSSVAIPKVETIEIKPWTACHSINDKLNESLLLHRVADMLVAFHIHLSEENLSKLEVHFTVKKIIHYLLSIFYVAYLIDFIVKEFLHLGNVV